MSNITFNVDFMNTRKWISLEEDFISGRITHCAAITAPLEWHMQIVYKAAELYLGISNSLDNIEYIKKNRDLIILGELEKAPRIDDCRMLIDELALKPIESQKKRRLAVIMAADKLLKPAANCLLKISEEPPDYACILFMLDSEGGHLMPTLKSRANFIVLDRNMLTDDYYTAAKKVFKDYKEPKNDRDLLNFVKKMRNLDYLEAAAALGFMVKQRIELGGKFDLRAAGQYERLRHMALSRRLSGAMLSDIVMLMAKGWIMDGVEWEAREEDKKREELEKKMRVQGMGGINDTKGGTPFERLFDDI